MSEMSETKQAPNVRLQLEGMTCASCAARIERSLNKLDGVEATVNFATEQATIRCDEDVPVERLIEAVEAAGYGAHVASRHTKRNEHAGTRPVVITTTSRSRSSRGACASPSS